MQKGTIKEPFCLKKLNCLFLCKKNRVCLRWNRDCCFPSAHQTNERTNGWVKLNRVTDEAWNQLWNTWCQIIQYTQNNWWWAMGVFRRARRTSISILTAKCISDSIPTNQTVYCLFSLLFFWSTEYSISDAEYHFT